MHIPTVSRLSRQMRLVVAMATILALYVKIVPVAIIVIAGALVVCVVVVKIAIETQVEEVQQVILMVAIQQEAVIILLRTITCMNLQKSGR